MLSNCAKVTRTFHSQVTRTFVNKTNELISVYVNGETIKTTPGHPFYVPSKGWTEAINLRAGDVLLLQTGNYVIIELIQHEILENPINVYNFEVEDFHTYFVGFAGILVHNKCHGNSLKNTKKTQLYVLRDSETNVVKKIGETTRGVKRYSKKFYRQKGVYMKIFDEGTKKAMHYQQHRLLKKYYSKVGKLPELNKSLW